MTSFWGTQDAVSSGSPTVTFDAGWAVGDFCFLFVFFQRGIGTFGISASAGWTEQDEATVGDFAMGAAVYTRELESGDSPPTISLEGSYQDELAYILVGVVPTSGYELTLHDFDIAAGSGYVQSHTTPAVTNSTTTVIGLAGGCGASDISFDTWTEEENTGATTTNDGAVAYATGLTASSIDTDWTSTGYVQSISWTALLEETAVSAAGNPWYAYAQQ